jgi:hypothetical protein
LFLFLKFLAFVCASREIGSATKNLDEFPSIEIAYLQSVQQYLPHYHIAVMNLFIDLKHLRDIINGVTLNLTE